MRTVIKVISFILALGIAASASGCGKPAAAKNRLETIISRGYIEVATEPAFAPNEFIDPSKTGDDKYVGSDIELAKYIADKLGVKLKIVPLEFSAVLAGISEGKYDLAISALAYKPDRAEAMILSKGYYFSKDNKGYGLLIREADADAIRHTDDLADKTIVYQSGSLQEMFAKEQIPACKEEKRVSATTDGFLMVQESKADACVTAIETAELYIQANKGCGMTIVQDFRFYVDPSTDGTRIGIPLGETELEEKINSIIDEVLASGIYEQWYEEYSEYAANISAGL